MGQKGHGPFAPYGLFAPHARFAPLRVYHFCMGVLPHSPWASYPTPLSAHFYSIFYNADTICS